jgi:hypothetical protein
MVAFTKPINSKGKEKKQQVNPALRLPAERVCLESIPRNKGLSAVQKMEGFLKIV